MKRRNFLRTGAMGAAIMAMWRRAARAEVALAASSSANTLRLGIAGYTFRKFSLDDTLPMLRQLAVRYLCIKDFHLPLTATTEDIDAFHRKCREYGVTGYAVGPIYMGTEAEVDHAFEYARRVGVKLIVGVPYRLDGQRRVESPELLRYVEQKVRQYDLRYAIHNHGPDDLPYPTGRALMQLIGPLDRRIGICLDVGHNLRAGVDPIEDLEKFGDRVYDLHLKNVTAADKTGKTVELGRGLISIPDLARTLLKIGYNGVCSLEFEKDPDNPLPGVAESIGYFRGVLAALGASAE